VEPIHLRETQGQGVSELAYLLLVLFSLIRRRKEEINAKVGRKNERTSEGRNSDSAFTTE
jgi:hypothetical protein